MKTLVIDDAKLNREVILNFAKNYTPQLEIIGQANSVESAIQQIKMTQPELVFLDIELGDGTAFDVLEAIEDIKFSIIFITAYNQYALEAFKVNAVDYLLKPMNIDQFKKAVNKAMVKNIIGHDGIEDLKKDLTSDSELLSISTSTGFQSVKVSAIMRCQADGKYTMVVTENGEQIISSKNLKEFEVSLSKNNFFRIHHGHLINLNQVKSFNRSDSTVTLQNNEELPISQRKKKKFVEAMNLI